MSRDPYLDSLSFNALIVDGDRQAPILMECEPAGSARLALGQGWNSPFVRRDSRWARHALVRVHFDAGNEALFEEYHRMTEARVAFLRAQEKDDPIAF